MIDKIKELVGCDDAEVSAKAEEIVMMHTAYEEGQITKEMYAELLEDVKRTTDIQDDAEDMKFKSALVMGVYGILQVV
jgi:hypothetical protein